MFMFNITHNFFIFHLHLNVVWIILLRRKKVKDNSEHILDHFKETAEYKETYFNAQCILSVQNKYTYRFVHSNIAKL